MAPQKGFLAPPKKDKPPIYTHKSTTNPSQFLSNYSTSYEDPGLLHFSRGEKTVDVGWYWEPTIRGTRGSAPPPS